MLKITFIVFEAVDFFPHRLPNCREGAIDADDAVAAYADRLLLVWICGRHSRLYRGGDKVRNCSIDINGGAAMIKHDTHI